MDSDFLSWVNGEVDRRGWRNAELARRMGVSDATVSRTLSGEHAPSFEFCVGLARALGELPETVLRRAGLLPPLPGIDGDASIARTLDVMRRLTPQVREEVVQYVLWRYEQQKGE